MAILLLDNLFQVPGLVLQLFNNMSGSKSIFDEEPDPRIKWALELLGNDGMETTSIIGHYAYPLIGGLGTYAVQMGRKLHLRRPKYVGWPITVAMVAGGWFTGSNPDFPLFVHDGLRTSCCFIPLYQLIKALIHQY